MSPFAERTVIGRAVSNPIEQAQVIADLRPEHFTDPLSKRVFSVLCTARDKGETADLVYLKSAGIPYEDVAQIGEWAIDVYDSRGIDPHIRMVREAHAKRSLAMLASAIPAIVESEESASDAYARVQQELTRLGTDNAALAKPVLVADILTETLSMLDKGGAVKGALRRDSGLALLDDTCDGIPAHGLIVIAARPAVGKSAALVAFARHMGVIKPKDEPIVMFSMEMDRNLISCNLLSAEAEVPICTLRPRDGRVSGLDDEQWGRVATASNRLANYGIHVFDDERISPLDIRARCFRILHQTNAKRIHAVLIDYLQLLDLRPAQRKTSNRQQEIGWATRELKILSRELSCPVIVAAQLNRDSEKRGGRPRMSDLRESGDIEQDADMVILLHRPGMGGDLSPDDIQPSDEWIIDKNRGGPTGSVPMVFTGECVRWQESQWYEGRPA